MTGGFLKRLDWVLIAPIVFLLVISLATLQSIDSSATVSQFDMTTQYVSVASGLVLMFAISLTDKRAWLRIGPWLYVISIVLLTYTLVSGSIFQGAQRWIEIGSFQLQPSEIAKFGLIAMLARLLSKRQENINKPWTLVLSVVYMAIPTMLIVLQPDLSTAVLFVAIWFSMLVASYLKPRIAVLMGVAMILVVPLMVPLLATYQQDRLETFISPQSDPLGKGYNSIQATIAIGSGGLLGKGLDSGTQSQLNFLPAQHTDFIFAVIAEKLGFVGAMAVILAFSVLILRLFTISWKHQHNYGGYVAFAVCIMISVQVLVNIGMNLGLVPVTGLPLPFMSYGGTHIVTELALIGFVISTNKN